VDGAGDGWAGAIDEDSFYESAQYCALFVYVQGGCEGEAGFGGDFVQLKGCVSWNGGVHAGFQIGQLNGESGFLCFELGQALEDGTGLIVGSFEGGGQAGDATAGAGKLGDELVVLAFVFDEASLVGGLEAEFDEGQVGGIGEIGQAGVDDGLFDDFGREHGGVAVMAAMGTRADVGDMVTGTVAMVG
jgi:hypothetical protein